MDVSDGDVRFEGHRAFVFAGFCGAFCLEVKLFLDAEGFLAFGAGDALGGAVWEES